MTNKMGTRRPVVLAVVSDLHAGSTLGLCPPRFQLDDGGDYVASKAQRWLWHAWLDYCKQVAETCERLDAPRIVILNGDMVEGNHHHTLQTITNNETTMMRLAYTVLAPLVERADRVYVTRGTEAHVGDSARLEEKIAEDIGAVQDGPRWTWYHLPLNVQGVSLDIAHHGRMGRLPWTRPNALNGLVAQTIIDYAEGGQTPPRLLLRAHLHQWADTGTNYKVTRGIAMRGWQLTTGYVRRFAPAALGDIGGLIIVCRGGEYELVDVAYKPRPVETIRVNYE